MLATTIPFAHAGHWLAGLAYAAPVLVLLGWMAVAKVKDARARREGVADGVDRQPPEG
jgi:hypothetical protein